ncbi:hypothetical protein OKW38_002470 [Paraburkholderia sp. MM5496-R1]
MASKNVHLAAILAQRLSWTQADRLQADRLATVRSQIDKLDRALVREGFTVKTAAGTDKTNPKVSAKDKFTREEGQLTRRLQLGAQRVTDNGRSYQVAASPVEMRAQLWEEHGDTCRTNLIPGLWRYLVRENKCEIDEDQQYTTDNPMELPVVPQS